MNPDGSIFEGWWTANQINGNCRYISVDGFTYEGEFMNDEPHG